jgi:hypothetical protein
MALSVVSEPATRVMVTEGMKRGDYNAIGRYQAWLITS